MTLLGSKTLNLVARLADGGTVFYAQAGVSIPNLDDPDAGPQFRVPAWISSIRPGRAIELLPDALTADLTPGQSRLYANGNDWIVSNDLRGPRRFVGNGFVTLLRKSEHDFSEFAGLDRRGRWLFHKPAAQASTTQASATQPTTSPATQDDETLIIDPTLPDPIPRLPVVGGRYRRRIRVDQRWLAGDEEETAALRRCMNTHGKPWRRRRSS